MDAGLNDFSIQWALVQPEIASFARMSSSSASSPTGSEALDAFELRRRIRLHSA
jgi:hypothetical protein